MFSRVVLISHSMTLMKIKRTKRFTSNAFHLGLDKLGIENKSAPCFQNLSYDEIASHERSNGEGLFIKNGAFAVDTGKFTGRSPMDKYIVEQSPSKNNIWWGQVNRPMKPETFDKLYKKVTTHFTAAGVIYVFDGYCGAHKSTQKKVRFITELAWQHHFVTNMFIRPTRDELQNFQPDFTVINACKVTNPSYRNERLNSEVFITFNIEKNVALIGGTYYGGEMKKGIFSMMNYWLPLEGIMSMHCSANVGPQGDSALFFGLSGTGKTTLSADPKRLLIGDDEHGWDDEGIFNFEGGCYAKTINLTEEHEPEIFRAIQRDALLENCYIVPGSHEPDYTNITKTENGRVSYPIYHIKNHKKDSKAGHPTNCIFLTCDAYGVLPPVSRLSSGQAQYHFLSGYTAKVAGTERGVTEPQATFSACFGAAFLPLHPTKYADLLQKKLQKYGTKVFLVNTGWSGGSYGSGKRLSLKVTRQCIDAILDGSINKAHFYKDPVFGFDVPKKLGSLSAEVLCPRAGWQDKTKYDETARKLADSFKENFKQFVRSGFTDYSSYGPN